MTDFSQFAIDDFHFNLQVVLGAGKKFAKNCRTEFGMTDFSQFAIDDFYFNLRVVLGAGEKFAKSCRTEFGMTRFAKNVTPNLFRGLFCKRDVDATLCLAAQHDTL